LLDKIVAAGAIATVISAIVGVAVFLVPGSPSPSPPNPGPPTTLHKTVPSSTTSPPPHPAFLSKLNPEGDTPQTGNTKYRGRELAKSIFYENVTAKQSTASPCEGAPEATCRATNYQMEGRNSVFTCKFAVEARSPSDNGTHWRVSVDGHVRKEGTFQPNSAAEPLSVRLEGGETLELRVTTNEPGLSEPKVIWGDATIR
jgi:NPCBM/NEW2 domain